MSTRVRPQTYTKRESHHMTEPWTPRMDRERASPGSSRVRRVGDVDFTSHIPPAARPTGPRGPSDGYGTLFLDHARAPAWQPRPLRRTAAGRRQAAAPSPPAVPMRNVSTKRSSVELESLAKRRPHLQRQLDAGWRRLVEKRLLATAADAYLADVHRGGNVGLKEGREQGSQAQAERRRCPERPGAGRTPGRAGGARVT